MKIAKQLGINFPLHQNGIETREFTKAGDAIKLSLASEWN